MYRYLVVANRTLAGTQLLEKLTELTRRGRCEFHVVVPAEHAADHAWNEGEAHATAEARLDRALARFRALDADVHGEVGDADPALAVEDVLQSAGEAFDAIVLSTLPAGPSRWLKLDLPHRLEGKFGLPVIHVVGQPEAARAR
jgi:GABA permease